MIALLDRWLRQPRWRRLAPVVLVIGVLAVASITCAGCGASQRRAGHSVLNAITDVADPTYERALAGCDAARDFIVEREGTTWNEDRRAMDAVHRVCDRIVPGFEAIRETQVTARAALDGGLSGVAARLLSDGLSAWRELQALVPELLGGLTSGGER